jgi:hypothetical protein
LILLGAALAGSSDNIGGLLSEFVCASFQGLVRRMLIYSLLFVLCSTRWSRFHGSVQTSEAEHRLADRAEGCFLIRFSTTSPGSYTISKVKKGGTAVHQRIEHKNALFHVASRSYATLELLLQGEYENLGLKGACPGSKYNAIFADLAAAGSSYVEANE